MIEPSSYFILFEFFRRYLSSFEASNVSMFDLFIWGGIVLLIHSCAILLKQAPGKTARILYTILFILELTFIIVFIVSAYLFSHTFFEQWAFNSFRLEPSQFYTYASLALFGLSGLIAGILSQFATKKPRNDSTLNKRQIFQSYAFFATLLVIGISLWNWYYTGFSAIIVAALLITEILSLFIWIYNLGIYILSRLFPRKPKAILKATPGKVNHFAMIVSAHNEEKVIGALVESFFNMDYPRDKYDVIVVCDNCTDSTPTIASNKGAITLERNDLHHKGKNEALKWVFDILQSKEYQGDPYDAYVLLSADNLVNDQYLNEINAHLNQGHEVMQTYQGSKNPHDTLAAKCTSVGFWLRNVSYQEARSRLNLSAQARGTGLVIRPSLLQEIPWEPHSLTAELEFSVQYLLRKNASCHWVHTARLYAEQPLTLKASLSQRTRWMQGHMATMIKYTPELIWAATKNFSLKQLDASFNLMRPFFVLLTLIIYAARWILLVAFPESLANITFIMNFEIALVLAIVYLLIQAYIMGSEGNFRFILWLPIYYLFSFTWALPIYRGFVKRHEHFWVFTFHARNLSINDIPEKIHLNEAHKRLAGLNNLHTLPLGQILIKAAIITGSQLKLGLDIQQRNGGYLGNILLETGAITENTLTTYVNIQRVFRESTHYNHSELHTLQLGEVLVNAELITPEQLESALIHQEERGGRIGEAIVSLRILSPEVLSIFLEVQNVIGAHYLDEKEAQKFIQDMAHAPKRQNYNIDSFILNSGLVSKQQLNTAQIFGETHDKTLFESLLYLGYVSPETLEAIESAINSSEQKSQ